MRLRLHEKEGLSKACTPRVGPRATVPGYDATYVASLRLSAANS